ncbi:MAG: response regulator [Anaerolineae bacterium]|nr:response regulator [Anaerolineae bacterium]
MSDYSRVLIVERNALMEKMVRWAVEKLEFQVVGIAANEHNALRMVRVLQPGAIIMDLEPPYADDLALLQHINQTHPVPIVVILRADYTEDLLNQAKSAGALAYTLKPVSTQELLCALVAAIDRFETLVMSQPGVVGIH